MKNPLLTPILVFVGIAALCLAVFQLSTGARSEMSWLVFALCALVFGVIHGIKGSRFKGCC